MAGRKQRNNVDYFPHYVKASRTKGILKSKFGHEGYSVWYQLLEILSATENHFYDCSDEIVYEYLLAEIGTNDETFKSIIEFLVRVGKIDSDLWNQDRVIWCQKLVDNLAYVYDKRVSNVPQKPALKEKKKPKPSISGPEMANSGSEMQRREVKGIKEEEKYSAPADADAPHSQEDFPDSEQHHRDLRRDENPNSRVLKNDRLKKGMLYSKPFLDWWEKYCRLNNRDKMPAAKAWNQHVTTWNDAELILVATANYANDLAGETWKQAKMGKTFLGVWREWIEAPEAARPTRIYNPGNGQRPEVGMMYEYPESKERFKIVAVFGERGIQLENGMKLS